MQIVAYSYSRADGLPSQPSPPGTPNQGAKSHAATRHPKSSPEHENQEDMASDTYSFVFRRPVAGLTDFTPNDITHSRGLLHPAGPSATYSYLDGLRSADDLIICLDGLCVPGPLTVHAPSLKFLGEGSQFVVHAGSLLDPSTLCEQETWTEEVAIKTPKFEVLPDGRLDLASITSRRQVNDFYLEVAALRLPALSNSRNVVRLLGWAVAETIHQTPSLVFELALGTMVSIFDRLEIDIAWNEKQQLCLDVGNGLDAIHKAGIVHSDLKPQNVLVFYGGSRDVPLVAKLADFATSGMDGEAEGNGTVEVKGLSKDWSAPEISLSARVTMLQMVRADVFSHGLLLLSFSCLNGAAPPCKDYHAAVCIARETAGIPASYLSLLTTALPLLLHPDSTKRPLEVGRLLMDKTAACASW
jgi:hypothetical protein